MFTPDLNQQQYDVLSIIHKILRPEEVCKTAIEAKYFKSTRKPKNRFIGLVTNRDSQSQLALFVVKKNRFKNSWVVVDILPIYSDTKIAKRNQTTFVLTYQMLEESVDRMFTFETLSDADSINSMISDVLISIKVAQVEGYQYGGSSHIWARYYVEKSSKLSDSNLFSKAPMNYQIKGTTNSRASKVGVTISPIPQNTEVESTLETETADLDANMKTTLINDLLKSRESEFVESKSISILTASWNVNGRRPVEQLDDWLTNQLKDKLVSPDVVAVGFQELDLSAENFLLGSTPLEAFWEDHVAKTLNSVSKYSLLEVKRLVGILLLIYVKEELLSHITNVQTGVAAVGIMGMMGNKGGVSCRFNIYDSGVCFINSHLNAHMDGVQRRNQDYHDISRRILFSNSGSQQLEYMIPSASSFTIFNHDFLFWFGDLNYRIEMNDPEVRQKVTQNDWKPLLECDQLIRQMKSGTAFSDFKEGPLDFAPTYKYDPGTSQYDTSEKSRTPAWCDRILWHIGASNTEEVLQQISYARHELFSSDHKPISSLFQVKVKRIIQEKRHKVYQDVVSLLDKIENESRPTAIVDSNHVQFENVKYLEPVTRIITLENTGKVIAKFHFIPKLDEHFFCKPWLTINPPVGIISPGQKIAIHLTVLIGNKHVALFNSGNEKLEDILILHLDGATDHFISLSGNYLRSCFGMTLNELVRHLNPVRMSPISNVKTASEVQDAVLSIPKEIWRMVDFLYKKGMDTENLFLESGVEEEMAVIRECLDTGEDFTLHNFSVHSIAESLLRFLDSLAEPLIPFNLYDQVLDCETYTQCKQIMTHLSPVNYNVFYYLVAFLREVLCHSNKNGLSVTKLALVFSSAMIRLRSGEFGVVSLPDSISQKKVLFLVHFLNVDNDLKVM